MTRSFIAGGAGFIGSHVANELIRGDDHEVVVYDNLVSGDRANLVEVLDHPRLELVIADLKDAEQVTNAMRGCDDVYLFAANPDIARAVTEPGVDFWEGPSSPTT